ncbi:MAG: DUF3179 domain-containing protein [Anditalea sp.]
MIYLKRYFLLLALIPTLIIACNKDDNNINSSNSEDWLIPKDEVRDGGPGKDGIPSIDNPKFTDAASASYLNDNDLVFGYATNGKARAYPHPILDWHEIINDDFEGKSIAVIYCPLTGTGMGWDRSINGQPTTFGVSGLLYNSNVIPYDRATDSYWSQMRLDCVHGELAGNNIEMYQLVETTWKTWKEMYPNTDVVSQNTGFNRNYSRYPYGDYKINNDKLLFPVENEDNRLPGKERVLGVIIEGKAKVYSINSFGNDIGALEDNFQGKRIVLAGSKSENLIVSFERILDDGTELQFQAVQNSLPIILQDNEGNEWDIFGKAINGPRAGEKLKATNAFIGFWFSWPAFYPDVEIYN